MKHAARRTWRALVAPWERLDAVLRAREDPERDVAPPGTDLLASEQPRGRNDRHVDDDAGTLNIAQL